MIVIPTALLPSSLSSPCSPLSTARKGRKDMAICTALCEESLDLGEEDAFDTERQTPQRLVHIPSLTNLFSTSSPPPTPLPLARPFARNTTANSNTNNNINTTSSSAFHFVTHNHHTKSHHTNAEERKASSSRCVSPSDHLVSARSPRDLLKQKMRSSFSSFSSSASLLSLCGEEFSFTSRESSFTDEGEGGEEEEIVSVLDLDNLCV